MRRLFKKTLAALLVLSLLAGFGLIAPPTARADHYSDYNTLGLVKDLGTSHSMQGGCADETYFYSAKIYGATEASASIARTHRTSGTTTWLTNAATGTNYFTNLGHANDLDVFDIDGVKTLFVATGGTSTDGYGLVRFALNGSTATQVAQYNVKYNGSGTHIASAQVMSLEGDQINLICKRSKYIYTATIGVNQTQGDIELKLLGTLDLANTMVNGSVKDLSQYVQ